MFARKTNLSFLYSSGRRGLNVLKTFKCVHLVFALFKSYSYSPVQRKVLPFSFFRPFKSTPLFFRKLIWRAGKSFPTTPTRSTFVKKLALVEKYVAEPPNASLALPKGVLTVSSAIEPTTNSPIFSSQVTPSPLPLPQWGEEKRKFLCTQVEDRCFSTAFMEQ